MYLIDGYNLLYQTDFSEKESLIAAIDRFCRAKHKDAIIVFDGHCPSNLNTDFVQVVFTGDADAGIAQIIAKCDNPSNYVLVSSDKELRSLARRQGVETIRAEEFNFNARKHASGAAEKPRNFLTDSEAAEQLRELNYFKD